MNHPIYKEYTHAYIDPRLQVGDALLIVDAVIPCKKSLFYTATVNTIEVDTVYLTYADEQDVHKQERVHLNGMDRNMHILRLLPEEIFGETIFHAQLTNEFIHLVKQLGYSGRLIDIDVVAEKKEYTV